MEIAKNCCCTAAKDSCNKRCVCCRWCVGADRVVTWGCRRSGGTSSRVQGQLRNAQQIRGTERALAAILADGSVVTWGDHIHGGDSSEVQDQLKDVQQICATGSAFAAILADGTVLTWGGI